MASRGVNKVILVGNLGQDPEVRYMPNGGAVANITLATSESWRDKATGEQKEKTEWHRVVLFGKLAEVAGEYLRKGSQVYIEGSLQTRKWQDQSGQDRYTTEIVVNVGGTMQMLGGRQGGGRSGHRCVLTAATAGQAAADRCSSSASAGKTRSLIRFDAVLASPSAKDASDTEPRRHSKSNSASVSADGAMSSSRFSVARSCPAIAASRLRTCSAETVFRSGPATS